MKICCLQYTIQMQFKRMKINKNCFTFISMATLYFIVRMTWCPIPAHNYHQVNSDLINKKVMDHQPLITSTSRMTNMDNAYLNLESGRNGNLRQSRSMRLESQPGTGLDCPPESENKIFKFVLCTALFLISFIVVFLLIFYYVR
jgi:hypothetical protein